MSSVDLVFSHFQGRRQGIIRALTTDLEILLHKCFCDLEEDAVCLFGYPDGSWNLTAPPDEVSYDLPKPAPVIDFQRDVEGLVWASNVATYSDSWLLAVAFFNAYDFSRADRERLFDMINDLPTVLEVCKSTYLSWEMHGRKISAVSREISDADNSTATSRVGDNDGNNDSSSVVRRCGACGVEYHPREFWTWCAACDRYFHGKCVNEGSELVMMSYNCPSCRSSEGRQ